MPDPIDCLAVEYKRCLRKLRHDLEQLIEVWERDAKYGHTANPAAELREVLQGVEVQL